MVVCFILRSLTNNYIYVIFLNSLSFNVICTTFKNQAGFAFCKYFIYILLLLVILRINPFVSICFRNGCICCGSSTLLLHLPLQSLCNIFIFRLGPFSMSDPVPVGRCFLHLPISIPAKGTKLRSTSSWCGGLHFVDWFDGDISHQNWPHTHTVRKFNFHGIWPVTGFAGFQSDSTSGAWSLSSHGDVLFGTAANSCGRCEGNGEQGWLCKMEEVINCIPVEPLKSDRSLSTCLKLPINIFCQ